MDVVVGAVGGGVLDGTGCVVVGNGYTVADPEMIGDIDVAFVEVVVIGVVVVMEGQMHVDDTDVAVVVVIIVVVVGGPIWIQFELK